MCNGHRIEPLGDRALTVLLGAGGPTPYEANEAVAAGRLPWVTDLVPAYDTLTVCYDPVALSRWLRSGGLRGFRERTGDGVEPQLSYTDKFDDTVPYSVAAEAVGGLIGRVAIGENALLVDRPVVDIPVRYGGADGPDLAECAARAGLSPEAFIYAHSAGEYTVAMIGFMPGFPYLSGLDDSLAQPRRGAPRSRVPAGSVGIAGGQTGVYPFDSPGGWQIIGRTPLRVFDPMNRHPSLLRAGDRIRFVPITGGGSPPDRKSGSSAGAQRGFGG